MQPMQTKQLMLEDLEITQVCKGDNEFWEIIKQYTTEN